MHQATCFHRRAADASRIAAAARVPAAGCALGTAIALVAPALSAPRLSSSLLLDLLIGCRA